MNTTQIAALKQIAATAQAAYAAEQERLIAAGVKSQDRYNSLKAFKAEADAAHAVYAKFAKGQIARELDKIIAAGRPAREAAARARSPWKQAKFAA